MVNWQFFFIPQLFEYLNSRTNSHHHTPRLTHIPLVRKLNLHLYMKILHVAERYPKSSKLRTWRARHPDHYVASTCEAILKILGENPRWET
jgi:hypothetical protein